MEGGKVAIKQQCYLQMLNNRVYSNVNGDRLCTFISKCQDSLKTSVWWIDPGWQLSSP